MDDGGVIDLQLKLDSGQRYLFMKTIKHADFCSHNANQNKALENH